MERSWAEKNLIITYNASGAAQAAQLGYTVTIIDVIDMSTSLEAALQAGAAFVFGASPDRTKAPVKVNPYLLGKYAGQKAKENGLDIVIISEPRWATKSSQKANCTMVCHGISECGMQILDIVPNLGAEVIKTVDFQDKVVICVSDTGGVAYDAAWQFHNRITFGTVARSIFTKGSETAQLAAERVMKLADGKGIAVVAASSNSQEDISAANFIAQIIVDSGYLNI